MHLRLFKLFKAFSTLILPFGQINMFFRYFPNLIPFWQKIFILTENKYIYEEYLTFLIGYEDGDEDGYVDVYICFVSIPP